MTWNCVSLGLPTVNVPVLSNAIELTELSNSIASVDRNKIPFDAARPVPTMTLVGTASRVVRVPLAYPIFKVEYESKRKSWEQTTGVDGLLSVGRNGEFAHLLMEDVFWRTRWKVSEFLKNSL